MIFSGLAAKNNCRFKVPFLNENNNVLIEAHYNNGHIGINRTIAKIKENDFYWETLSEKVKYFIENCFKCKINKHGKKFNIPNKTILTKGLLECVVADGWQLDEELKNITAYKWVIDLIYYFSKFLMIIPVAPTILKIF